MKRRLLAGIAFLLCALPLTSRGERMVALMSNGSLRFFDSENPGELGRSLMITGLPDGYSVIAFDVLPTGPFYVMAAEGSTQRLFEVDPRTRAVTDMSAHLFQATATVIGFDTTGRNVSNGTGPATFCDNARIRRFGLNGANAAETLFFDNTTDDGDPVDEHAGTQPWIVALGSTNSTREARAAVLYGIDTAHDSLVQVDGATGRVDTVGPLGVEVGTRVGFDISGTTGVAYLSLGGSLYTVDLRSGAATKVGVIQGPVIIGTPVVVDIAVLQPSGLANISTRARVQTGDNVMIAGFIVDGGQQERLIVRGLGPSLTNQGVSGALANPVLKIVDGNGGEIATNDNWRSDQEGAIEDTGVEPTHDLEAAFVGTFLPGAYTAVLSGKDGATGVGLVEVYRLEK